MKRFSPVTILVQRDVVSKMQLNYWNATTIALTSVHFLSPFNRTALLLSCPIENVQDQVNCRILASQPAFSRWVLLATANSTNRRKAKTEAVSVLSSFVGKSCSKDDFQVKLSFYFTLFTLVVYVLLSQLNRSEHLYAISSQVNPNNKEQLQLKLRPETNCDFSPAPSVRVPSPPAPEAPPISAPKALPQNIPVRIPARNQEYEFQPSLPSTLQPISPSFEHVYLKVRFYVLLVNLLSHCYMWYLRMWSKHNRFYFAYTANKNSVFRSNPDRWFCATHQFFEKQLLFVRPKSFTEKTLAACFTRKTRFKIKNFQQCEA